ncbi:MAG TPA: imidazole glycerol phosphate synthase subunit HisF [Bacteroidales bacterium]|nr:imidazole glycerol phosphate synthase subunit HisF [Bacteroidales bacterium]
MLKKRIIPCLDIKDGRTVKGINFVDIRDAGDPVELAKRYSLEGADEVVFLDITATVEKRRTLVPLVERISMELDIPFTVGGGIGNLEDVGAIIKSGADKISLNTVAVRNPSLISGIAAVYGSQCVTVAIDTDMVNGEWMVFIEGGRIPAGLNTLEWALEAEERGAGEILLTSMRGDGTKNGFSLDITRELSSRLKIPVIASGGAGSMQHFRELFNETGCSAALAASIFHFGEISIPDLKRYLSGENISVRR